MGVGATAEVLPLDTAFDESREETRERAARSPDGFL